MQTILFFLNALGPDYQCDALLHGLLTTKGISVQVCCLSPRQWVREGLSFKRDRLWYMMYGANRKQLRGLYGKGFTLYGHITNQIDEVTPIDAMRNLVLGKYDAVIAGNVWRCAWLINIAKAVSGAKIVCVDGEDWEHIHPTVARCDLYYKRELTNCESDCVLPISFAIPRHLVVPSLPPKRARLAPLIPGDVSTYIYADECDYYEAYRSHTYGITHKKAGWDCLRHYEIAMNGCLPLMRDIEACPPMTMVTTSRELLKECVRMYDARDDSGAACLAEDLLQHVRTHNTTDSLAKYVLSNLL